MADLPSSDTLERARAFFNQMNRDYSAVHKAKEDLFWATYMATSDDQAGFARAENAFKDFVSDPATLHATRAHLARLQVLPPGLDARDALLHGLTRLAGGVRSQHHRQRRGPRPDARDYRRRGRDVFGEARVRATAHQRTGRVRGGQPEHARHQPLRPTRSRNDVAVPSTRFREIERWVLANGFLELVALRNRFARALGYAQLLRAQAAQERAHDARAADGDPRRLSRPDRGGQRPHAGGAWRRRTAPTRVSPGICASTPQATSCAGWIQYMPFAPGAAPLGHELPAPGHPVPRRDHAARSAGPRRASIRTASVTVPCPPGSNERGEWQPSQINFTADAKPDQVGSGQRAIDDPVPRRRPRGAFRQRRAERAVLLAGIRADVDGLRRNAVHVLRQPARRRRLAGPIRAQRPTAM